MEGRATTVKTLKNILIGIIVIILFPLLVGVAPLLGGCMFLGFLIISGLDAIGLIDAKRFGINTLFIIGGVIGALILYLDYLIRGHL